MACPVCNSQNTKKIEPTFICQIPNDVFGSTYILTSCNECGIWFKETSLSQVQLNEYYKQLPFDEYDWEYTYRLPHEKIIDAHLSKCTKGSSVLDVGCWTGRLLEPYAQRLKVFGIEPNVLSSRKAEARNIEILGAFVDEQTLLNHEFDCITMIDVFEHLPNPKKTIDLLLPRLKPKGRLVIVTGGTDNFAVKLASSTYWYFSLIPDHITFLNRKHIGYLRTQYPDFDITYKRIRHSEFKLKKYLFELFWLVSWRFINPNSPFRKIVSYKLPFLNKLRNVKDIILCLCFKDHYYIQIVRK